MNRQERTAAASSAGVADERAAVSRLLLVDDGEVFRERLARAFRERGFAVRTAGNYDEAMTSAREHPPQLAVVDLRMPGRGGLELVRDLKELNGSIHVLVLTGYGSIATAVEAVRLGAMNYLPKPADADDILAALRRGGANFEETKLNEANVDESAEDDAESPTLARAEWEHIHRVMADCGGNISEAARRLGIHRRSLQRKLRKRAPS
jgi:two-component system response regulator RegA